MKAMKYLVILVSFSVLTSLAQAQTHKVNQCVIENGTLKMVVTDYDPGTGIYSLTVNGTKKLFDDAYPQNSKDYAASATWYINNEAIIVNGHKYVKYGFPRILSTTDIEKAVPYKGLWVYVETGLKGDAEVIYLPAKRGCEFQPYEQVIVYPTQKKIYYDRDWKVTSQSKASYYRLVTLSAPGKPVGLVRDFYITGEKQWEGNISYLHWNDNSKDITEGVNTWYHKNGKKAAQVTKVEGKEEGVYRFWYEDGHLQEETEYKNGVMHGYRKTYLPNGKLDKAVHYTDGVPDTR
jgi:antitoxin component YwqK of YwqJK toxin-antitoxin module